MNRLEKNQKIIWLLKALLFSYVVTGISLAPAVVCFVVQI